MRPEQRHTARLLAVALIATAALAGCSNDASDNASSMGTDAGAAPAPAAAVPEQAGTVKDQAGKPGAQAPDLGVDRRSIVYTGSITVRVKDVAAAAAQVASLANGAGGFVGSDERHSGDPGSGTDNASLTLRVPAGRFAGVVQQLAGLGTEQQRSTGTEDVTEQTVDLDARIAVQQARVDSGRRLLAQAKNLGDLVMLEKEVATRESDLASLQAKKRRLADLVALSTITAVLLGPEAAVARHDDGPPGFLAGLEGGWTALVASLGVLLTVLGALLPWLITLGVPAGAVFYLIRRYARRRPGRQAPAFATAGAPLPAYGPSVSPPSAAPAPASAAKPDPQEPGPQ
jgi:Domain of unknown function (DUF4349)